MLTLLRRTCWWENMEVDLDKFSDNCLTCIRGRKRPAKQQAVAVKPSWLECWEEVAVDFEGPMHPEMQQVTGSSCPICAACRIPSCWNLAKL